MKNLFFGLILTSLFCLTPLISKAQTKLDSVQMVLDSLSQKQIPALNSEVNISVSRVRVDEFLRALANDVNLNLSIPNGLGGLC